MSSGNILSTERLSLIPIKNEDIEFIHSALSNPAVYRFYGVRFHNLEETKEQMKWYESLKNSDSGLWWKLVLKDTKKEVGACGFNDWNHESNRAEIGGWLIPEYWGQGLMSEALNEIIQFGFGEMELQVIEAEVETGNHNSIKMMERIGFEKISKIKTDEIKDDKPVTVYRYRREKP